MPIYFDNNSTTPIDTRVLDTMLPFFTQYYGNPSSLHRFGWEAKEGVDIARQQVAALIGAEPGEVIFTSGATESDNLALKGVLEAYSAKGKHIITTSTEHKAVLETCRHIEKSGGEVDYLPVGKDGLLDPDMVDAAIRPDTILIAVILANNETGVIQPVKAISEIARKYNALLFCDAAQAVGKIPVDVKNDGIDIMSVSSHKMYGPKGIGALYISRKSPRVRVIAQLDGGGQESGLRSGTLNVPAIVGFGKACELCTTELKGDSVYLNRLRNKLESGLLKIKDSSVNGSKQHRLPHITNMSFGNIQAQRLLTIFANEIALSSTSTCSSATAAPSHVLKAMGLSDELAYGSVRFGLGRFNTEEEVDYVIERMTQAIQKLIENEVM